MPAPVETAPSSSTAPAAPSTTEQPPAEQNYAQREDSAMDAAFAALEKDTYNAIPSGEAASESTADTADPPVNPDTQSGAEQGGTQSTQTQDSPDPDRREQTTPQPDLGSTADERQETLLAISALKRDGWDDKEIASLPRARVIELGSKRARVQRESEAVYGDLVQAQRALEDGGIDFKPSRATRERLNTGSDDADTDPQARDRGAEPGSPEASLMERLEAMEDEFPDEVAAVRDEVLRMRKQHNEVMAFHAQSRIKSAAESLQSTFPELKESEQVDRVVAKMMHMNKIGFFEDGDDIATRMKTAATVLYGDRVLSDAQEAGSQRQQSEELGQPASPISTQNKASGAALSQDDIDTLAYQALEEKGSEGEEAVQRRFQELVGRRTTTATA